MSDTLRPGERRTLAPEASAVLAALRGAVAATADFRLDSRGVRPGDVFLACPGEVADGRAYIDAAVTAGAAAVVFEGAAAPTELAAQLQRRGVPGFALSDLQAQAADLAAAWYGHPAEALTVIAVTGTNGKTSCTQ
ncbi:MAG: Mur ligase domain-containing protein [Pigmentiphaga sp.]